MVNNWVCSRAVTRFKFRYMEPLRIKVDAAFRIIIDVKRKWDPGQKAKTEAKYALMNMQNIDFHGLYRETTILVNQHEELVSMLSEVYSAWYNKVSSKGKQPKEMMSMQAEELQSMFIRIYKALEPLKLEIKPPLGIKTDKQ